MVSIICAFDLEGGFQAHESPGILIQPDPAHVTSRLVTNQPQAIDPST